MNQTLPYKTFVGTFEQITDDGEPYFHGRIANIRDLVTFQTTNEEEIQKEFEDVVDDYLEALEQIGRN